MRGGGGKSRLGGGNHTERTSTAVDARPGRLLPDVRLNERGQKFRCRRRVHDFEARPVPGQASGDHDLLFAVAFQGEIDERPAEGGQLERRRPPALDDGQAAGSEVFVEFRDVAFDLDPVGNGQRRRVEPDRKAPKVPCLSRSRRWHKRREARARSR